MWKYKIVKTIEKKKPKYSIHEISFNLDGEEYNQTEDPMVLEFVGLKNDVDAEQEILYILKSMIKDIENESTEIQGEWMV